MKNRVIKRIIVICLLIILALVSNKSNATLEIEEKNKDISNNIVGNVIVDKDIMIGEFDSVQDSIQYDEFDIEINSERVHNTVIMANQLLKNNLKETGKYSTTAKYPNAGLENNIFVPIIKVLIGMLAISLVVMSVKVRKK